MEHSNLTHHFLIAMPAMDDPNFARTLTYIAEHNDEGALGIIVNRPIDMDLAELFEKVEIELSKTEIARRPVFFGGPVQTDRGFVLHRPAGEWHSSLRVNDEIALTSSKDILEALSADSGPEEMLITLGYAGWSAGQLEQEIAQNAWLTVPADPAIIFDTPVDERLNAAIKLLGFDLTNLSDVAGHA